MLVSPVLTAVEEVEGAGQARKEKKKRRKAQYAAAAVPELMI